MQIERLAYFIEVTKAGSIKRASENINISQQALSQSIAAMEKELGVELFKRSKKGSLLTEKGEEVLEAALAICEKWDALKESLSEEKTSWHKICISISPFIESDYYAKVLAYIKSKYPYIPFNIVNAYPKEAALLLADRSVDIAIVSFEKNELDEFLRQYPYLKFIYLQKINVEVLVSKRSYLAQYTQLTLAQIKKQTIMYENHNDHNHDFFLELLKKNGIDDIVMVHSRSAIHELVAKDLAITFAPLTITLADNYKDKIVQIRLDIGSEIGFIGVLVCKDKAEETIVRNIIHVLQEK